MITYRFSLSILLLIIATTNGIELKPNGRNVCSKVTTFTGYRLKESVYVGYENYMSCCGLFCWSKCQKSRAVRRKYTKAVQQKITKTTYSCCEGWAPLNGECSIPICRPSCAHGNCIRPNVCKCNSGFVGTSCNQDVDECLKKPGVCDQLCHNVPGSYICSCNKGFNKVGSHPKNRTCSNVNECSISSTLCKCADPFSSCRASCQDTIGSYKCKCSKGYKLAGDNICVDSNDCGSNSHGCQHFCFNNGGKITCGCKSGFQLDKGDNKTCLDIDECSYANGGCEQICRNQDGSYQCLCRSGFYLAPDNRTCHDINECINNRPCDSRLGICENTRGSYKCSCQKGYALDRTGLSCVDYDECATNHHGCSHKCMNLIGSYQCACLPGLALSSDGRSCEDIDECLQGTHLCHQQCKNEFGSYRCSCRKGYRLHTDGHTCKSLPCQKLPEIPYGDLTCPSLQPGSICSYKCKTGYYLEGDSQYKCMEAQRWSGRVSRCRAKPCPTAYPPINGILMLPCQQKFGARCIVQCIHGYSLVGSGFIECGSRNGIISWNTNDNFCKAVQLCKPNPCKHGGRCHVVSRISYRCDCRNTGYIGDSCSLGLIEIPSLPTLLAHQTSKPLFIKAHPSREITITPTIPNHGLLFEPNVIKITYPQSRASFKIKARNITGRMRVYFQVSGESSSEFLQPTSIVGRVVSGSARPLKRLLSKNLLVKQCHVVRIGTCDNNDATAVFLHSSCPWDGLNSVGHISVGTVSFQVPFSVAGFTSPTGAKTTNRRLFSPRDNVVESIRIGIGSCKSSPCDKHFTTEEFNEVLRRNMFIKAYLHQVTSLSPWFLRIYLNPVYNGFDSSNFQSLVYNGRVPSNLPSCPNLPKLSGCFFSILTSKASIDLQFMSNLFHVNGITTSCLVLDLCHNVYYMSLPITHGIDTTEQLKQAGVKDTELILSGLSISTGATVQKRCIDVYQKDDESLRNVCISGNFWTKLKLSQKKAFMNYTFHGDVVGKISDVNKLGSSRLDEPYTAIGSGDLDLTLAIPVGGSTLKLQISDKNISFLKTSSGFQVAESPNDGMKLVTEHSKIKFIYESPTLILKPRDGVAEIDVNYILTGGAVIAVKNQVALKLKLSVMLGNINGLFGLLKATGGFQVETSFLQQLKTRLLLLTTKLRSAVDYKTLIIEISSLQELLSSLRDVLDGIITRVSLDPLLSRVILARCTFILKYLDSQDITPLPTVSPVKEKFSGVRMKFHGTVCLRKLCIHHCFLDMLLEQKAKDNILIKCRTKRHQYIRSKIRVEDNTVVIIRVSTHSSQFDMQFPVVVSISNQNAHGVLKANTSDVICNVPFFTLRDGVVTNVTAHTKTDSTSTWKSLVFSLSGHSDHMSNFSRELEREVGVFLTQHANQTAKKINDLKLVLQKTKEKFKIAEDEKQKALKILKDLEYEEKNAVYRYNKALSDLQNSKQQFRSYQVTSYLRNYQYYFDKRCKLQTCKPTCVNRELCHICQHPQTVNTNVLSCKNVIKKVRITQEEQYDGACHQMKRIYRNVYTGTCQGGGDSSEIQQALPNWSAGIGNTIGGPVGALIGGLVGGVVGQFFVGCEDTWSKVIDKKLVVTPCKKLRLHSVTKQWAQSECNNYEKAVLTRYGAPRECNCTNECVNVRDPQCVASNRLCQAEHKRVLKRLLSTANVYEDSATRFLDNEKNVTVMQNNLEKIRNKLNSHRVRVEQVLVSFNQILAYKKKILADVSRLSDPANIDYCLMDSFQKFGNLQIRSIKFGPVTKLETNIRFSMVTLSNKKLVITSTDLNVLGLRLYLSQHIKEIVSKVYCPSLFARQRLKRADQSTSKLFFASYSKADDVCNKILGYYMYLRHAITSLRTLAMDMKTKERKAKTKLRLAQQKLNQLTKTVSPDEVIQKDIETLIDQISALQKDLENYGKNKTIDYWLHDMETFNKESRFLENYGFEDSVNKILRKFHELGSLSGIDEDQFYRGLENLQQLFDLFLEKSEDITNMKDLEQFSFYLYYIYLQMWKTTKFCFQSMPVRIHQPKVITTLIGDQVSLHCDAATKKNRKYIWYQNKQEVAWEHSDNLTITINSASEGSYRCKVETLTLMNVSNDVYFVVEAKPTITEQPNDVTVILSEEQSRYFFTCNVSGLPRPNITWKYTSFDGKFSFNFSTSEPLLYINKSTVRPGFYMCIGRNKHGLTESRKAIMNVLKSCTASQVFQLSLSVPRAELTDMLTRIFYSDKANKAWSTSKSQTITIAIKHVTNDLSTVTFKLLDTGVNQTSRRCELPSRIMLSLVSTAKSNMVQLLKNVLKTLSVKTDESNSIAEIRENLRSTLLLEPLPEEFCPRGYYLHESQFKCVECSAGHYEKGGKCIKCFRGTYQPKSGSIDCNLCPPGQLSTNQGAVSIIECK